MERQTRLGLSTHGRQPNPTATQRNHAGRSRQGYGTGVVCPAPPAWAGLSLSPPRSPSARKARSCFCEQGEGNFRARLFLACARMQVRAGAEIEVGLLAPQARGKQEARPRKSVSTPRSRLVSCYSLAMRNPFSETPVPKTSAVSGLVKGRKEGNRYHG